MDFFVTGECCMNKFILNLLLLLIVTVLIGCSGQKEKAQSVVIKQPVLNTNSIGLGAVTGGQPQTKLLINLWNYLTCLDNFRV